MANETKEMATTTARTASEKKKNYRRKIHLLSDALIEIKTKRQATKKKLELQHTQKTPTEQKKDDDEKETKHFAPSTNFFSDLLVKFSSTYDKQHHHTTTEHKTAKGRKKKK